VKEVEKDAPWLLTVEYYPRELMELIKHLKLEKYYLYGSSWGTIVAQEFALLQPKGLCGLLLDGALCDA
jgi:pimeloyl-ACP methyl ester carboxylesterase